MQVDEPGRWSLYTTPKRASIRPAGGSYPCSLSNLCKDAHSLCLMRSFTRLSLALGSSPLLDRHGKESALPLIGARARLTDSCPFPERRLARVRQPAQPPPHARTHTHWRKGGGRVWTRAIRSRSDALVLAIDQDNPRSHARGCSTRACAQRVILRALDLQHAHARLPLVCRQTGSTRASEVNRCGLFAVSHTWPALTASRQLCL
eukprot:6212553-Pleurochrysis_carterae.AAC.1